MQDSISKDNEQLTIALPVGGTGGVLAEHPGILQADIVLAIDTPTELEQLHAIEKHPHLYRIPLGVGQTTDSLCAQHSAPLGQLAKESGNSSAHDGMSQARTIGGAAAKNLIKSAEFNSFLDYRLPALLHELGGGVVASVLLKVLAGTGGGTASLAVVTIVARVVQSILARTSAIVTIELLMAGALSYLILGRRVAMNAPAAVADALHFTVSSERDCREARRLQLVELPPTGRDRHARNRYMLALEQASNAKEVRTILGRIRPNHALTGPLGNVELWRTGYYRHLHPRTEVAPFIAGAYAGSLRQILDDAFPEDGLVQQLLLAGTRSHLSRTSLEGILRNIMEFTSEKLVDGICAPGFRLTMAVTAMLHDGRKLALTKATATWAMPPVNTKDLRRRLTEQASCVVKVEQDLLSLYALREELLDRRHELESEFSKTHRRLTGNSFLAKAGGSLSSTDSKLRSLHDLAIRLRATSDLLVENAAEIRGLTYAVEQVKKETEYLSRKIGTLADCLSALVPKMAIESERLVEYHSIDHLFPALWEISSEAQESELLRLVCSSVRQVTLAGLARIVGADEPRPDAVAKRIAARDFEVLGPPWGGAPHVTPDLVIHVLPPIDDEYRDSLRTLIAAADTEASVCFADTVSGVVNACTLLIKPVSEIDQVFTSFYKRHLIEANADSRSALVFPDGPRAATALGLDLS